MVDYIVACRNTPREQVRTIIRVSSVYVVVPFSNSQAHRIAEKYWCTKILVRDLETVVEGLKKLAEIAGDGYDVLESCSTGIIDYEETVYDDGRIKIVWYSAPPVDGYMLLVASGDCLELTATP